MKSEFIDAVLERLESLVPSGWSVTERFPAYQQGGPHPHSVTASVDYSNGAGNPNTLVVGLDVDVWAPGPDYGEADDVAHAVESGLHGWSANTERQGTVRVWAGARQPMADESEKIAHVTMRLEGRGLRRTEQ